MIGWLLNKIAPNSQLSISLFPPPPTYSFDQVPDLTGKVVVVTGASPGSIGYEIARVMVSKNAKVYLACRSKDKADRAIEGLKRDTDKTDVHFHELDLVSLSATKASAEAFLKKEPRLDILFSNAGIMLGDPEALSKDDLDLQFQVNTLAGYYFATLLVPAFRESKAKFGVPARISFTSSATQTSAPGQGIDFDTLDKGSKRLEVVGSWGMTKMYRLYGQSKFGQIVCSHILNDAFGDCLIAIFCHPGPIVTNVLRDTLQGIKLKLAHMMFFPTHMGAYAPVYAATMGEGEEMRNVYVIPWGRTTLPDPRSNNEELRKQLKEWMDQKIKASEQ